VGSAAFDRLVEQVMTSQPYASATRVFWIVDNGSDHRGQRSVERLQDRWPKLVLVHTPVHASWLNQAEIYHSIIQRKLLDPNDFQDTAASRTRSPSSSTTTTRSPSPSNGTSPATSSPRFSNASNTANPTRPRSPPDHDGTYGGQH
jgi:hypothetical protein